jgi:hypothetical protein
MVGLERLGIFTELIINTTNPNKMPVGIKYSGLNLAHQAAIHNPNPVKIIIGIL